MARLDHNAIERLIGALQAGADMAGAAKIAGVTRDAVYKKMDRDEPLRKRVKEACAVANSHVRMSLYKEAIGGNVTAQIFWLKNRLPGLWRDRRELIGSLNLDEALRESMSGDVDNSHRDEGRDDDSDALNDDIEKQRI